MGIALEVPRSLLTLRGLDNAIVRLVGFVLLYMSAWVVVGYKKP